MHTHRDVSPSVQMYGSLTISLSAAMHYQSFVMTNNAEISIVVDL